jgi:hypothetical protein
MENPVTAWIATITFSFVGVWSFLYWAPQTPELLPQAIFYAVLVLNTYFSIQFYAKIEPRNASQATIDTILVLIYIVLGLSLGHPVVFTVAALCLFIAAPVKYMLMLGKIPYEALLRKKIRIDGQGTALCAAVLLGTLAGYGPASAWVLAVLFSLANIYLLLVRPMYRL